MSLSLRLGALFTSWGVVWVIYALSGLRGADQAYHLTPWAIDAWFPFDPRALWLYMSFFVLVLLAYLKGTAAWVAWLWRAVMICAVGAGAVYLVYPTTMDFPPVTQSGISAELLKLLMAYDAVVNCAPSLHVALSLVSAVALGATWRGWRGALVWIWAVGICLSILVLRRHQMADLLSGAVLAAVSAGLAPFLPLPRWLRAVSANA